MQRHTAFPVPLAARNLNAIEPARGHDLDTQCAQTHGVLHGAFHGAAKHDALFKLLRDAVCNQLGIDFRLAHFLDVDGHWNAELTPEFAFEVFDVLAFFTNHHARTRRENGDTGVFGRALDQHPRYGCVLELALEVLAHLDVLSQHAGEVTVIGIPARCPVAADRQAKAGWVDFLSHIFLASFSFQPSRTHGTWVF